MALDGQEASKSASQVNCGDVVANQFGGASITRERENCLPVKSIHARALPNGGALG